MACWAEPHWRSTVVPGTDSGKPGRQRGVAGDVHRLLPDGHGAAHDHVLHQGGVEVVAGQQGGQRLGRQVGGVPPGQAPTTAANGGSDGVDDHGVGHGTPILTPNQIERQTRPGHVPRGRTRASALMDQHEERAQRSRSGSRLRPGCRSARGLLERRPRPARGGDPGRGAGTDPGRRPLRPRSPTASTRRPGSPSPPTRRGPAPVAVYVHGGSWVSGNYDTGGFISDTIGPDLAARGFVVVGLDYRLGPKWPDQIADVKCAIRYLPRQRPPPPHRPRRDRGLGPRARAGTWWRCSARPGRAAGWDVGPYLDQSSGVQAVVDMAGPSDLLTMGNQGDAVLVAESFVSLLGRVPEHAAGRRPAGGQPGHVRRARRSALPASSTPRTTTRSSTPSSPRSWPGTSGPTASRTSW